MNLYEIDTLIYNMNTVEKSHMLHYLLGYAKSDMEFGRKFEEAINKNYKPVEEAT